MKTHLCVLLVCLALCGSSLSKLKINPMSKHFVNDLGEIKIFHGVNVAYKVSPFLPPNLDTFNYDNSFSEEDAKLLKKWGMTVVRLTFYWEAVEAVRGVYNDQYISQMKKIVETCAKHGISVYLDLHQDVANRQFCGEGMPDWAIKPADSFLTKFPAPLFNIKLEYGPDGYPTKESCLKNEFGTYYATYQVEDAYQNLWTNWNGVGDSFGDMWAYIASNFKDYENVIGYELLNEPFTGNLFKNPSLVFNNPMVMPFYTTVHNKIRAVDDETIIFFEYPTSDEFFDGVHGSPGGKEYNDRQLISYHVYATAAGDPKHDLSTNTYTEALFRHAYKKLDQENLAGFLTEFGAISGLTKPGVDNIKFVLDTADTKLQSWTYWQYKFYDDYTTAALPANCEGFFDGEGNVIAPKVKALTRPYIHTSPIHIRSMSYDYETGVFKAQLEKSANSVNSQLLLYLNEEYHYTNGVVCELQGCTACKLSRMNGEEQHYFGLSHEAAPSGILNLICKHK